MEKKHIEWIDITKGLLITLVVLGHIISDNKNYVQMWIYSFHIPAFFIINGILKRNTCFLNKYNFRQVVRKQIKIWVTYTFFSILLMIRLYIQYKMNMYNIEEIKTYFLKFLLLNGIGVLWYLPTFELSEIIFYFYKKNNKNILYIVSLLIIMVIYFSNIEIFKNIEDINNIGVLLLILIIRTFIASSYIYIGYYLAKIIEKKYFYFLGIFTSIFWINGNVDLNQLFFNNIIFYYVIAIAGTICIIAISKLIEKIKIETVKKILILWGKDSLLIMITHSIFLIIQITKLFFDKIIKNEHLIICYSLVLTMFLETTLIWIYRYLKKILKLCLLTKRERNMKSDECRK